MIYLSAYGSTLKRPFAKRMSYLVDFFIKTIQFIEYAPKRQLGITNVADETINM